MRLLLIEEEPLIAMTLRLELEDAGHTVLEVPAEAATIVESSRSVDIDAVMIDIDTRTPGHGLALASQVREQCPDMPLLLLTAEVQITPRLRSAALGIIRKPFVLRDVLAAIESIAVGSTGECARPQSVARPPASP